MKKFAITALAAALALGACAEANAPADDATGTDTAGGDTTIVNEAPDTGDAAVADSDEGTTFSTDGNSISVDSADVDATVGEDGVEAKIKVD